MCPITFHVKHPTAPVADNETGAVSFVFILMDLIYVSLVFSQNKGSLSRVSDKDPFKTGK